MYILHVCATLVRYFHLSIYSSCILRQHSSYLSLNSAVDSSLSSSDSNDFRLNSSAISFLLICLIWSSSSPVGMSVSVARLFLDRVSVCWRSTRLLCWLKIVSSLLAKFDCHCLILSKASCSISVAHFGESITGEMDVRVARLFLSVILSTCSFSSSRGVKASGCETKQRDTSGG